VSNLQNITAAGLWRQENRFNITANNLSNVQTAGFKKDALAFQEILSQAADQKMNADTNNSVIIFRQGDLQKTGNNLNLAIEGDGLFKIQTPAGIRFTRNGEFRLNKDKILVQGEGFPVLGKRGEISLNGTQVDVDADGTVRVDGQEVDKIAVVTFRDLTLLKKEGNSLMALAGDQEEMEANQSQIQQGTLEQSNVNALEEMVLLMESLRTYEAFFRLISASDQLDSKVVNELGRV
jgi:flagellar basal-body rod protein FlgF